MQYVVNYFSQRILYSADSFQKGNLQPHHKDVPDIILPQQLNQTIGANVEYE